MSNSESSWPSAYQWDFCLEREVECLQEWVQAAFPLPAPAQHPSAGMGDQQGCLEGSRSSPGEAGREAV